MGKYSRIQKLCKERGYSIAQMERDLGFARGSVAKIDNHKPSAERIAKICAYLNVSPMSLLVDEDSDIDEYKQAEDYTYVINNMEPVSVERTVHECSAGEGRINDGYEELGVEDGDSQLVKIVGDSMYPSLHDGDMVRVVPATETVPSDYTIVKINGDEATCKHVEIQTDGIWLRGENPDAYQDRFYTVQEALTIPVQIVGKAVEIVSRKL